MGDVHPGGRPPSEVMPAVRKKRAQPLHPLSGASQRSLHNAPIFRLLLKVAVNGTHQCDCLNFCGGFGPQHVSPTCSHLLRGSRAASVPARPGEAWLTCMRVGVRSCCVVSFRFVSFRFVSFRVVVVLVLLCFALVCFVLVCSLLMLPCFGCRFVLCRVARLLFPGVLFLVVVCACVLYWSVLFGFVLLGFCFPAFCSWSLFVLVFCSWSLCVPLFCIGRCCLGLCCLAVSYLFSWHSCLQ